MNVNHYIVAFYILFWLVRINGCIRRGGQPLLRGEEWFFNVPVQPGFYTGPGKTLLHRYWLRMLLPFAIDIPIAIAIFASGRLFLLKWLIAGLCALIHVNHVFSVNTAERQARSLALPGSEKPTPSVALSLTPRRLRDYTNFRVEWALGPAIAIVFAWLTRYYVGAPGHKSLRLVFGVPIFFVYAQLGMLLIKCFIVAWRSPAPQGHASEFLRLREETRKYYLRMCDWMRISLVASIVFWPFRLALPETDLRFALTGWFSLWTLFAIAASVWVEIKRKDLARLALRMHPVTLPEFVQQSDVTRWPVCYQPSAPMLVLKGAHGYSLNLGNRLMSLGVAYFAGLIALFALLPIPH